ncbi:LysR family transcriptional regulator [Streptomyces sp. NPDC058464]|uniref:LysR family transcriptional regulator n=1 Tax=Streptomyces sp. NPDC058464 TaxID=3346511 RepID=UPI00366503E8
MRLVRSAVVLADELHFGRAATRLSIVQQTLSAQISQLETRLGVALFVRDRRHVELTPAGELFVRRGRELLAEMQDLLQELRLAAPPLRLDVVSEGLTPGVIARELGPRMTDVQLQVVQGQGLTASLSAVSDGRVDLAFGRVCGLDKPLPPGLAHRMVRLEPLGIVLPADHELAALKQVPMAALAAHPLVLHTAEEAAEWEDWNEKVTEHFGLTIGWRLHGHGRTAANVAVLFHQAPAFAPLEAPLLEGVVVRPVVEPVPLARVSVVWRSQRHAPERLRRAISAIQEISTGHRWLTLPTTDYWLPEADRPNPMGRR